jgi:type VI secretion system secreted protein Hcp
MAFDAFLIFTGGPTPIIGETQDSTYKGAVEISEFSFGAETTLNITSASSGAGAGKTTFKEFTVKKQTDIASPYLLQCLGTGDHYKKVQLFLRKSGSASKDKKSGKPYLVFAFGMVAVKSIEWSGSTGDDVPTESVIFEYGEMVIGYYKQKEDGTLDKLTPGSWSKLSNQVGTKMVTPNDVKNDGSFG